MLKSILRHLLTLVLAVLAILVVVPATSASAAGIPAVSSTTLATEAQMHALAKTIDPKGTMTWKWAKLDSGVAGLAEPWNRTITISSGYAVRYLRPIMIHEFSHALEYKAFGSTIAGWYDAENALDSLLGPSTTAVSWDRGLEEGADCIAKALGADYLSYGCPAALRAFGARIAAGAMMTKSLGSAESVVVVGRTVTVSGWSFDPVHPTQSNTVRVTDNGKSVNSAVPATGRRADINALYGTTGGHGFKSVLHLTAGPHRICVAANAIDAGKSAANLSGCRTVTVR